MTYNKIFQKRLKETRVLKKLSQEDLAKRGGFQVSAISHFETGSRTPSFDNLIKLSISLNITIDYLVGRKEFEVISGRVMAYVDDWPRVRRLEKQLIGQRRADMDLERLEEQGIKLTWNSQDHA